jgi:hypothetical protein
MRRFFKIPLIPEPTDRWLCSLLEKNGGMLPLQSNIITALVSLTA